MGKHQEYERIREQISKQYKNEIKLLVSKIELLQQNNRELKTELESIRTENEKLQIENEQMRKALDLSPENLNHLISSVESMSRATKSLEIMTSMSNTLGLY